MNCLHNNSVYEYQFILSHVYHYRSTGNSKYRETALKGILVITVPTKW